MSGILGVLVGPAILKWLRIPEGSFILLFYLGGLAVYKRKGFV